MAVGDEDSSVMMQIMLMMTKIVLLMMKIVGLVIMVRWEVMLAMMMVSWWWSWLQDLFWKRGQTFCFWQFRCIFRQWRGSERRNIRNPPQKNIRGLLWPVIPYSTHYSHNIDFSKRSKLFVFSSKEKKSLCRVNLTHSTSHSEMQLWRGVRYEACTRWAVVAAGEIRLHYI